MIDKDQNLLYRGKVAKAVTASESMVILLTQLLFSGHFKQLDDAELLALLSCMCVQTRAGKAHVILEEEISKNFWAACLLLEAECSKLIDLEAKHGVMGEEKDPMKRLNYYFYELVYMWCKKVSFSEIKDKFPNMEEGILIKMIRDVQKLCKVVREMSILVGDTSLG